MSWRWLGSWATRGDNEKIELRSGWLLAHVKSHVICFYSLCPTAKTKKMSFVLQDVELFHLILCFSWSSLAPCPLHMSAQIGLGKSAMALRYICLFSARPGINDPAKLSSHRSQPALICHYSGLIGWISVSLPVGWAGGEMSWDKQLNSQIWSREGGMRTAGVK